MICILPKSFQGFCAAIKKYVIENDGHVIPCNEPLRSTLGFICTKTNERFYLHTKHILKDFRYLNSDGAKFFKNYLEGVNIAKYLNDKACKLSFYEYANSETKT